ncbi:hypothetical protein ACFPYJ_26205 [Paenibacillus solisilvae]|uniref:YtkA-like domain-containing protein n=1 Tax=Paenibacillus solisilvae TaxID=2486751 RepID=A0ABW0W746_9BACL
MNNRKAAIVFLLTIILIIVSGCSGHTMDNVDIHPPTQGLLHYLQKDQMANVSDRGYKVSVKTSSAAVSSKNEAQLTLEVADPSGVPVNSFTEDMTKLMHLIIVSSDLSSFSHVHPEYEGEGKFTVKFKFPSGGDYLLITEFMPGDKGLTVYKQWIKVEGDKPQAKKLTPDTDLERNIDGVNISLSMMPDAKEVRAGQMAMLDFRLTDAATGKDIPLEPYLGTSGHCVILDSKAKQYLHVHAVSEMSRGSSVMFHTAFPTSGTYKVWGQFQYRGKVIVVPFVITVQ